MASIFASTGLWWDACQISERSDYLKHKYRAFETLWAQATRHRIGYWNGLPDVVSVPEKTRLKHTNLYQTAKFDFYDDTKAWKSFPHYQTFVRGIHPDSPHKGPAMRSFDVFFVEQTVDIPIMMLWNVTTLMLHHWNVMSMSFYIWSMMTSSNGNIFRVTGPLCGEFTGLRWIPHTKASGAELWCFLWSAPE